MSSKRLTRRKGVVSSGAVNSRSNSLDWDSPSTKTGTVKRRPVSSDCSTENELNLLENSSGNVPTSSAMKSQDKIHKATLTIPIKSPESSRQAFLETQEGCHLEIASRNPPGMKQHRKIHEATLAAPIRSCERARKDSLTIIKHFNLEKMEDKCRSSSDMKEPRKIHETIIKSAVRSPERTRQKSSELLEHIDLETSENLRRSASSAKQQRAVYKTDFTISSRSPERTRKDIECFCVFKSEKDNKNPSPMKQHRKHYEPIVTSPIRNFKISSLDSFMAIERCDCEKSEGGSRSSSQIKAYKTALSSDTESTKKTGKESVTTLACFVLDKSEDDNRNPSVLKQQSKIHEPTFTTTTESFKIVRQDSIPALECFGLEEFEYNSKSSSMVKQQRKINNTTLPTLAQSPERTKQNLLTSFGNKHPLNGDKRSSVIKQQGKMSKTTLTSPITSPEQNNCFRKNDLTSLECCGLEKSEDGEQPSILALKFLPWIQHRQGAVRSNSPCNCKSPEDNKKKHGNLTTTNISTPGISGHTSGQKKNMIDFGAPAPLKFPSSKKPKPDDEANPEQCCVTNVSCLNATKFCDFGLAKSVKQPASNSYAKPKHGTIQPYGNSPSNYSDLFNVNPEADHDQKLSNMLRGPNFPTPMLCITKQPKSAQQSCKLPSASSLSINFEDDPYQKFKIKEKLITSLPTACDSIQPTVENCTIKASTPGNHQERRLSSASNTFNTARVGPEDGYDQERCAKRKLMNIPTLITSAIYKSPRKSSQLRNQTSPNSLATKNSEDDQDQKRRNKLNLSNTARLAAAGARICQPAKSASPHCKSESPPRDAGVRGKIKEVNCIQESKFKVDGSGFDGPKCLSLTEANAYLIERKASGFNFGKAGIVSDSDSGIASPLSPSSLYGFVAWGDKNEGSRRDLEVWMELERLRSCSCVNQQIQIYTDWANHYLEKARSKKRVNSLATDCSDGVLLADVIESVTCQKIPDINRKPKTPSQMLDNINICLSVLRAQHVAGVESVSGQDLRDGRLKAVLALFFALSRHKQAAKQRAQQVQQQQQHIQHNQQVDMTPNRSLVGPHKGGSSIPLPGSALPSRKCPPDKVRPVAGSSRASSPALSMIPRAPPSAAVNSPYQAAPQQKNSMLDKLKLFKSGDRPAPATTGKRTSSSSGVSSARSERSDSSVSLEPSAEIKPVRNNVRLKQQRPQKSGPAKNSPGSNKKDAKGPKTASDVEKHAQKVAGLSKLTEPKVKAPGKAEVGGNKNASQGPQGGLPTHAPGTGIPKPTAAIKGTSKVPRDDKNTSAVKSPTAISRESSQASIAAPKAAVALVSPMKAGEKDNQLSESSHSASTGQHSNSSESSVIYKPSSESGSEQTNVIPNRKEPLGYLTDISEHKLQPPLEHDLEKPLNTIVVNHVREGSQGEDDPASMNVEPMRPLFRGYCSTLTLPGRSRHYPRVTDSGADYCEIALANGYLSDGEVLRNPPARDLCDGYMSEGGAALYARRLQTMPAHMPNGTSRVPGSLTVLTEQAARRGRVEEPPPPPAPRVSSRSSRNAGQLQDTKHGQWKRYTDSPGVGSPPPPAPAPSSPTGGRRERRSSPHGSKEKSAKVRGVPQSFGYVKRNSTTNGTNGTCTVNGTTNTTSGVQNSSGKTAQVSAVPRTKVKVSGGTQTCSSDLQQPHSKLLPETQYKSYSLTGNTANQLSQSVRERLMMGSQSLPKGAGVGQEYGLILRQARVKASDGSLSDTQAVDASSPYAPWLRHSNTYSVAPRLSETDSLESLSSVPGHRGSLTHARLLRDSPSRLSRSNSIRSTKSEKLYPSMLHRNTEPETEPYYCLPVGAVLSHWSQPTSPAPGSARTFPLSPTHSTPRHSIPKNDDVHGSSISLVSTASSLYSSAEEKQAHEIRKLRRELTEAQEKVQTLTSQLSTNAHVVAAFEQSLSSMTQRLQNLTATAEKKDSELSELKAAMESLRQQSSQVGIGLGLARQPSSDSVSSLSSACSLEKHEKKKKKGWLRSSFTKAFSRNAKVTKVQTQQNESENERQQESSPPPPAPIDSGAEVAELQKQLREKDLVLTDIRLEALSSAHQLESLKDTVMKMRSEMLSLKQNNERLQRLVGGPTSVPPDIVNSGSIDPINDLIAVEEPPPEVEPDGKRIAIAVYLGQPHCFEKYYTEHYGNDGDATNATGEIAIAHTSVGAATSWAQLDNAVRRAFKQHVARLDPGGGLGLGGDAIANYKLGEAERKFDSSSSPPHLLPVGYAVGCVTSLHIVLQPVAALAFEALIPKGVAQRFVSLLSEHRRLVLCGAPGTGKTHLATRLAEFHAQSLGRDPAEAVATFNCDNKSGKELRQYLTHLGEQAAAGDNNVLPCVVVLDNLHKAGPLADALGSLPRNLPCLLGTMAQSACSATSLQLQHGFRWVLVAPHMEPARGLLGRVLRRRLASLELEQGLQPELAAVLGWLPRVWQHLNAFLETHSSGDVAIGPRLFLGCPLELDAARAWFADVWNYSIAPYLREAAREGLQLYGRRAPWTDPCQFILDTYPWPGAPPQGLTSITARDVGLETGPSSQAENDGDPLLNMLMRLQEAANYSSPHSNDSDCNSLDSNLTHESNVGTESVS